MTLRLLLGTDRPAPRALGVLWVTVAGYVMGTAALGYILHGIRDLLILGIAPALLSGLAALIGVRPERPPRVALVTMVASFGVSLLCAPTTFLLLFLVTGEGGPHTSAAEIAGQLLFATLLGSVFGAPLGILFGAIYSVALSVLAWLRDRPSRASLDLALGALGIGWILIGLALLALIPAQAITPFDLSVLRKLRWLASGVVLCGALVTSIALARTLLRLALAKGAARGLWAGWAVVPADRIDVLPDLPRLFPFGRADAVLVRCASRSNGPFRSRELLVPVARMSLPARGEPS